MLCCRLLRLLRAQVQDIEEVVSQGKTQNACPYYASRAAVKSSELVCIPYTSLVHRGTREALGVNLEGNVVVIDEAHNLIDAVNEVHSAALSQGSMGVLLKLFQGYLDKFQTRLSPGNVVRIRQVVQVLKSFQGLMAHAWESGAGNETRAEVGGESKKSGANVGSVFSVAEFCLFTKIDNINLFDLLRYFQKSKILPKLHGYYERSLHTGKGAEDFQSLISDSQVSVVQPLETFLRCVHFTASASRVRKAPNSS